MMRARLAIATLSIMLGLACGAPAAEEEPMGGAEETTAGGEQEPEVAADVAWSEMNQEQKFAFMQERVMPQMQALFQEHDAERYADFSCATCHGENAQEVGFEMPNGVAPLQHEQIPAMFASEEPMAQLMTQRVWPQMAELLGQAPFDPETGEGFSCMNCHATAE